MACKYWYDGKWRTETEFKKILSEGLLNNLLADNTVSLEQLMPSEATQQTLVEEGATKAPVTLRIRHKAQTKINNGREPGKPNIPLARNPKDVIEEFVAQGGKPFELKFVIKVKGELRTGKGSANEKLKQNLLSSPVGNKIVSQLQEGIVYMLVPSVYGMYPIRVFNNFLTNTKSFGTVKQALEDLKKSTKVEDIAKHRKTIESLLYRTTVTYDNTKKTFTVKQIDGKNNILAQTFPTTKDVADFLGKQLQRVAYNNINSGNYNEVLASNGVITTDLFSDSASFFNSSSFVLEAFRMSEKDQEALDTVFDFTFDEESIAAATVTTEKNEEPITPSQNKTAESPIYSATIDELIPEIKEEPGPSITIKLDALANDASKFVTIESVVKGGKILVSRVTKKQKVVKKNETDTFEPIYDITSGNAYKEAVLKFFDSKEVKAKKDELAGKPTPVAKPIEAVNAKKAEIKELEKEKAGLLAQSKSFEKITAKTPKTVSVYLSSANTDGSFNKSSEKKSFVDGASILAFEPLGNNRFAVYIDSKNPSAVKMALQYPDKRIDPTFDRISAYNPKATSIQTVKPSIVELQGDKYILIEKGTVDFDNVGINRENAKTTDVDTTKIDDSINKAKQELQAIESPPTVTLIAEEVGSNKVNIIQTNKPTIQTIGNVTFGTANKQDTNENNEDAVYVDTVNGIFILADGMGGEYAAFGVARNFSKDTINYLLTGNFSSSLTKIVEYINSKKGATKNINELHKEIENILGYKLSSQSAEKINEFIISVWNKETVSTQGNRLGATALKAEKISSNTYKIQKVGDTVFFVVDKNGKVVQKHGLSDNASTQGYLTYLKDGKAFTNSPKLDEFTVTLNEGETLVLSTDFIETDKAIQDFIDSKFGKNLDFAKFQENNKDDDSTFITIEYDTDVVAPKQSTAEEVAPAAPKSFMGDVLASMIDVTATMESAPIDIKPEEGTEQSLESLVAAQSNREIVPEQDISFEDVFGDDLDTEGFDGATNRGTPNVKLKATETVDGTSWSQAEEIQYLKDTIGVQFEEAEKTNTLKLFNTLEDLEAYLPKETYEMLLETRRNGKFVHGLFTTAAVFMASTAEAGTSYHEAFHVVFNLALPLEKRIALINEAYVKYRAELLVTKYTNSKGETKFKYPTYLEVEELLADKFMEFVLNKEVLPKEEAVEEGPRKRIPILPKFTSYTTEEGYVTVPSVEKEFKEIGKFFKGLSRMLTVFYKKNRVINIDNLFENIDLGVYKDKINFSKTSIPNLARLHATDVQHRYVNPIEEAHAFEYLSSLKDEILEQYRAKVDPSYKLNPKELIAKMGVHTMYSSMLSKLKAEAIYNKKSGNTEMAQRLAKLYFIFTNGKKNIKDTVIEGKGIEVTEFTEASDLLLRFNSSLRKEGLYITYNGLKDAKVKEKGVEENEEDSFKAYEEGEDTYEESWMRSHIETNPMESTSQRLKSFFAKIPKYKSTRKNSATMVNSFGVTMKEDPGVVFKTLATKISNSYSVSDMLTKLSKINRPYIKDVLNEITKDEKLLTDLWIAIGQKSFTTFSFVWETNNEMRVVTSNRKTLDNVIKEELIANFLVPSNPLLNTKNNVFDVERVNTDEAANFLEDLNTILPILNNTAFWNNKKEVIDMFNNVAKTFQKYKIELTADDLVNVWEKGGKQESYKNVVEVIETIQNIAVELVKGNNPFTSSYPTEEEISREVKKEGRTLLEKLAKQIMPVVEKDIILASRNINNKTVYSLIQSGFINKQMETYKNRQKLTEYYESIKNDAFVSELPLLKDLLDDTNNTQDILSVIFLDGFTRQNKNKAVTYTDMSDIEMEATSMAMFYNNGANDASFFKMPIPSDAPTLPYIKSNKLEREEIIDKLVLTAKAEYNRIRKVKTADDNVLDLIPNYKKRGEKFILLSFLNGKVNTNQNFDEALVRAEIDKFFSYDINISPFFQTEMAKYKKEGIITSYNAETGAINFAPEIMDKTIKDGTTFFKNYLLNTYYFNTQISTLLAGDPAFYKSTGDLQKRFKQVISPGTYANTSQLPTYYKAIILNDEIVPTEKATFDHIESIISKSNLTPSEKNSLIAFWTAKTTAKDGNNTSDAATYLSPELRKQRLEALGRWTPEHDKAYERVLAGTETIEDLMLMDPPFKPEKPFVFTQRVVENGDGTTTVVPIQIKNAETVLTKSFAQKKDQDGNFLYPKLAAIYEDMVVNQLYDTAIFESAVKVGGIGNTVEGGKVRFTDYTETDGKYSMPEGAKILDLRHEDWRLQQETPPHYIDDKTNFATQLRNLIIADLDMSGGYTIGGKTFKGAELALMYQKIVVEDLKSSFEEVSEEFLNSNGDIDYTKLVEILKEEILDRDLGQDYLDAIALVPEVLVDGSQTMTTTLPLYHPMIMYKMESVLNSFFKNRVTKQKIRGGSLVNTTSFGVSDKLKIEVSADGTITYQALMPHTSKKYFPTNENGEVDIEFVQKHAKELLKIIGIRIPTEDKYSMFNIRIVGFTPPAMGPAIILPREATTMAGLDFDIDKLYFMSRAFTVNKKGIPKIVKYIKAPKNKTEALESASNIYADFKSFKKFAEKYIKDPKQREAVLEARRALTDKQASNTLSSKEIEEFKATITAEKKDRDAAKKLYGKNSEVYNKHQDNIDNLYAIFNEEMEVFDERKAEIGDQANEILDTIADVLLDVKFNSVEFNTKQARDNMKLDIMEGVLENSHTAPSILNVGNFDILKERAAKIRLLQEGVDPATVNSYSGETLMKESEKLDDAEGFNFFYPSVQLELFKRNMMGKKLIGIFANHNTHHAKAQFTNLQLKNELILNEQSYIMLNKQYDNDGNRISRKLATNLAAVVDNAKDPVASFINMNTFTANTIALLERLGVSDDYIYALVNQPVVLELTREYFNNQGSLVTEKNFANIKNKWQTILTKKLKEAPEEELAISITTDTLEDNLKGDGSTQYYKVQLEALKLFEKLYGIGEELAVGIQAAKVDTTGVGPTSADNYVTIHKQEKILQNVANDTNSIVGLEEVFWKGSANQLMMPGFNKYGILSPINILEKIFPSIGTVDTNTFKITYSLLGDIKNQFASFKANGLLKEKEARMLNTHFMSFIASGFPFFNYSQSKEIIKELPAKVAAFNKTIDSSSPYKYLFNNINVVKPDGYAALTRLEFYSTGKSDLELSRLKASWERMLVDTNPTVRQLGLDLIKYTFFTNGYGYGPNTFAHLIPIKFWTDAYQLENNITDSKGNTFNQYLKKALFSDKIIKREDTYRQRFVDQFIRNNFEKEKFVQSVKVEKVLNANDEKIDSLTEGAAVSTLAAQVASGVVLTSKGYLVVNKKKNKATLYPNSARNPIKYLKIYVNGKPRLYEYVQTEFEQQNPSDYQVSSPDRITYKPVSKLGLPNYILEYNYGANIENSVLVNAKNTPNPKVAPKAATMDDVSNSYLASFQAEEAAAAMQGDSQDLSTLLPPSSTPLSAGMDFLQNAMDRSATMQETMNSEEGVTQTNTVKKGIEISSNAKGLAAALTNPTELAKSKGNLTESYPVEFRGKTYKDAEAAYQALKSTATKDEGPNNTYNLMVNIIKAKLEQYPRLVNEITKQGGSTWILSSTHQPTRQNSVWETGGKNWFIKSLNDAYLSTQPSTSSQTQTNTWDEYKALIKELIKVDKDAALEIGVLTEEEFLSLPEKEKKMAIWQIKNC